MIDKMLEKLAKAQSKQGKKTKKQMQVITQNRINLTKKILLDFLKKEKIMGVMYVYGFSHHNSVKSVGYNIHIMNDTIKQMGETYGEYSVNVTLTSIIGKTIIPRDELLIFPIKKSHQNKLCEIYARWCNYIDKNWAKIMQLYNQTENIIEELEFIDNNRQ